MQNSVPYAHAFDPTTGTTKIRMTRYKASGKDIQEDNALHKLERLRTSGSGDDPPLWHFNPLVVSDHIIPQHVSARNRRST